MAGQSRAAKKRAKKRQQQQERNIDVETVKKKKAHEASKSSENDVTKPDKEHKEEDHQEDKSMLGEDETTSNKTMSNTRRRNISCLLDLVTSPFDNEDEDTAPQRASEILQYLLDDVSIHTFYEEFWEQKPLHIVSKDHNRFDGFLSLESLQSTNIPLKYGHDLNVTRYQLDPQTKVKRRSTLDPKEMAVGPELWDEYFHQRQCTVRYLCPHKISPPLHALLSLLESEWGCMVGCNAYLTPQKSQQGFAPHYDDIEAFCLQLEGTKRWKVYKPPVVLPRTSSRDYTESELEAPPELDILLRPGDLLYMPRGWIHQAVTTSDEHSLHVTVSAMQQWSWGDLMELCLPDALSQAIEADDSLRAGLPRNMLSYMGVMHDQHTLPDAMKHKSDLVELDPRQEAFRTQFRTHLTKVVDHAMQILDSTCDQMGIRFLSDRLPPAPPIPQPEVQPLLPTTLCRIARPGIARLVIEVNDDDADKQQAVVYHCIDNSVVYHEKALSPLEFELDDAPAIEQLLTTLPPYWISIMDLTHESIEDKVGVAQALLDEGLLSVRF